MEASSTNHDNLYTVTVPLTGSSISVYSEIGQQSFVVKQFVLLDLKTAFFTIKQNSEYYLADKPLPFGLKSSEKLTTT